MNYLIARPEDEYLENVDTVFLFGAGTSAHMRLSESEDSACVPTDTSFFHVVKDGVLERWCTDQKILNTAQQARQRVFAALRHAAVKKEQLFKQPGSDCPQVRLEELFCRLEMLRMLGRYVLMRLHSEWKEAWKHPSDALRDLIAIVMAYGRPPGGNPNHAGYMDFAGRVLRGQQHKAANTYAVLSLNYEIGLESAVRAVFENDASTFSETTRIAHSLRRRTVGTQDLFHYALPHRQAPRTSEAVPILKLHGSCNWAFCPECQNVEHVPVEEPLDRTNIETLVKKLVGVPGTRQACQRHAADWPLLPEYVPHIVPPTWNKWMGDYTMRHIWRQAYGVLRICRKLFLVGTSLPETDVHLRHLFRVAFAWKAKKPQVYVVNRLGDDTRKPASKNESLRGEYRQRAQAAVGVDIPEENCLWQSFEEKETVDSVDWIFERVQQPTR